MGLKPKSRLDVWASRVLHSRAGRSVLGLLGASTGIGILASQVSLPDLAPALMILFAVIAGLTAMCVVIWWCPANIGPDGVRVAAAVRNSVLSLAVLLSCGAAMFVVGLGELSWKVYPGVVVIAELLALGAVAHRAAFYGAHPSLWDAKRARKEKIRRARQEAAASIRAEDPVEVAPRPAGRAQEPVVVVAEDPDDLTSIDLGGDDDETVEIHGVEVVSQDGTRFKVPATGAENG